ncbi:hypothetical protein [Azotosporobacter soli]|uniref:hypothetical protein n=1 Tax=Azotosporobacter soli TaxID=3055040 RepID=UPI0031FEA766
MKKRIIMQIMVCLVCLLELTSVVSATELNKAAKAKLFTEIVTTPVWYETTVDLSQLKERGDKRKEKGRELALLDAENKVNELLIAKVVAQKEFEIAKDAVDFAAYVKIVEEDNGEKYGKPFKAVENGNKVLKATYRFKLQCQQVDEINPFFNKTIAESKGSIKDFKETADYWDFVANGYGFYEGFEDIDTKVRITAMRALDSGCEAIIAKVSELGIKDEETQQKLRDKIKENRNYVGEYGIPGFAVKAEIVMTVRISKKDAAISFL